MSSVENAVTPKQLPNCVNPYPLLTLVDQLLEEKHFVEEVGLMFERVGMPRMAGRIFGWLLMSDPPHQSTGELIEALQASKGSISTMTRLLIQLGFIERVSLPGNRRDYFCIKPGSWTQMSQSHLAHISAARQLAEKGLEVLRHSPPERRDRLEEMRDIHEFWERELPKLNQRWEEERQRKLALHQINPSQAQSHPWQNVTVAHPEHRDRPLR